MSLPGREPAQRAFDRTPNAERYLLEADSLRRRQLLASLLHGTTRTWRERRRIWPAVIGGIGISAVIVATIAVYGAFQQQKRINEQQQRRNNPQPTATVPAPPKSPPRSPRRPRLSLGDLGLSDVL